MKTDKFDKYENVSGNLSKFEKRTLITLGVVMWIPFFIGHYMTGKDIFSADFLLSMGGMYVAYLFSIAGVRIYRKWEYRQNEKFEKHKNTLNKYNHGKKF